MTIREEFAEYFASLLDYKELAELEAEVGKPVPKEVIRDFWQEDMEILPDEYMIDAIFDDLAIQKMVQDELDKAIGIARKREGE